MSDGERRRRRPASIPPSRKREEGVRKVHEFDLESVIRGEFGRGKSIGWQWSDSFEEALLRWIAVEVDLYAQSIGRIKRYGFNVRAEAMKYWPKDSQELVVLTSYDREVTGALLIDVTGICHDENGVPTALLLKLSRLNKRGWYDSKYHMIGHVVEKGGKTRIERNYKPGPCPRSH
jgi:hypothetical protein